MITVRDNGMGMEQEKAETLVAYQAKGMGLRMSMTVSDCSTGRDTIRIFSAPGEGTNVVMRFPKEGKKHED